MMNTREELRPRFPGIKMSSAVIGLDGAGGSPIEIVLNSENRQLLMDAANDIKSRIQQMPGAIDVSLRVEEGYTEVNYQLIWEQMARLGLDASTIVSNLQL